MDSAFLADVESIPTSELRDRRDECRELEAELSYSRRLLQGKIDILAHELKRRSDGGEPALEGLVSRLPSILVDEPARAGQNRLLDERLPANAGRFRREAERLVADLAHIDTLSVEGLSEMVEQLAAAERKVSEQRRSAQHLIDRLNAELVRRYKKGEEDPSSLLSS
jgi:anti-sigma-K factor RsiG